MTACLDASVAVKLLVTERDSGAARRLVERLRDRGEPLVAPCLLTFEVTSALARKAAARLLSPEEALQAARLLGRLPLRMVHPLGLHVEALQLCRQYHRLSVYDAHYLALAQRLECEFWTADEELVDAVRPGFPWVHALAEIEGASENP